MQESMFFIYIIIFIIKKNKKAKQTIYKLVFIDKTNKSEHSPINNSDKSTHYIRHESSGTY